MDFLSFCVFFFGGLFAHIAYKPCQAKMLCLRDSAMANDILNFTSTFRCSFVVFLDFEEKTHTNTEKWSDNEIHRPRNSKETQRRWANLMEILTQTKNHFPLRWLLRDVQMLLALFRRANWISIRIHYTFVVWLDREKIILDLESKQLFTKTELIRNVFFLLYSLSTKATSIRLWWLPTNVSSS